MGRFMARSLAAACGGGLLAYLVLRIGPATLLKQVAAVGAGIWLVLLLGGFSHLIKSWAWRLTIPQEARCVSLPRAFGLRLISEAIAQLGVTGRVGTTQSKRGRHRRKRSHLLGQRRQRRRHGIDGRISDQAHEHERIPDQHRDGRDEDLLARALGQRLCVRSGGVLAKLFSEAVEAIDKGPVEGVRATGATKLQEVVWGVIPQVAPLWTSYALYRFESNSRSATVLGLIGAGCIGQLLFDSLNAFAYEKLSAIVIVIVVAVSLIDLLSQAMRSRLL